MAGMEALSLEWFAAPSQGHERVICTGVFDLLHVGHVRFLSGARAASGSLVVGVEDDVRVRARKGDARPLQPAAERAEMLSALAVVDGVFVIHGPPSLRDAQAYAALLAELAPVALAITEGDPARPGKEAAASLLGARVVLLPLVEHRSTTGLVARARDGIDLTPWEQRSRTPAAPRCPAPR